MKTTRLLIYLLFNTFVAASFAASEATEKIKSTSLNPMSFRQCQRLYQKKHFELVEQVNPQFLIEMQAEQSNLFSTRISGLEDSIKCLEKSSTDDLDDDCLFVREFLVSTTLESYQDMTVSLMLGSNTNEPEHIMSGVESLFATDDNRAKVAAKISELSKIFIDSRFSRRKKRTAISSLREKSLKEYQSLLNKFPFLLFIKARDALNINENIIAAALSQLRLKLIEAHEEFKSLAGSELEFSLGNVNAIKYHLRRTSALDQAKCQQLELLHTNYQSNIVWDPIKKIMPWVGLGIGGCFLSGPIGCGLLIFGSGSMASYMDVTHYQNFLHQREKNFYLKTSPMKDVFEADDQLMVSYMFLPLNVFDVWMGAKAIKLLSVKIKRPSN